MSQKWCFVLWVNLQDSLRFHKEFVTKNAPKIHRNAKISSYEVLVVESTILGRADEDGTKGWNAKLAKLIQKGFGAQCLKV